MLLELIRLKRNLRYIDDIFFTSNRSIDTINQMLDEANSFHPNIRLVRQIGTSVSFLDVFIKNKDGVLETSVYRKDLTEPSIVPFRSDHPRHVFNNIIDGALTRALRYTSTLFAFNEERRLIKLILLYTGYPPRFIYTCFKKFFTENLSQTSIMPQITTPHHFLFVRSFILNGPTVIEHEITSRSARTIDPRQNYTIDDSLVRMRVNTELKSHRKLIIHYTYEERLATYSLSNNIDQ